MRHVQDGLSELQVVCNKEDVLEKLRANLKVHATVVEESKVGWREKADALLKSKLDKLQAGKLSHLSISLNPPVDHSDAYKLAIEMLEMHQESKITLDGQQVHNLMMDEWDWSSSFWVGNENYSVTAMSNSGKYK